MLLAILPNGTTLCLYTEDLDLDDLGPARLYAHPTWNPARAGGTLTWDLWEALSSGHSRSGAPALAAEVAWIEENVLG